jgi:hypothetical protein
VLTDAGLARLDNPMRPELVETRLSRAGNIGVFVEDVLRRLRCRAMGDWFQPLQKWLLEWNKPGTLGDVLPWLITSVVTVVSILVMYFYRRVKRKREQALQVTAWIDELPLGGWVARIRNSSRDRIENIVLMVAQPSRQVPTPEGWDDNAQLFTAVAIGPERSLDFPLAPSTTNHEQPRVRLYFSDRSGQAWILHETGELSRQRRNAAQAFVSRINIGRHAAVSDHSGTVGPDNRPVQLAAIPISRIDIDPKDGNNISITLVPDETPVTPANVAEMQRGTGLEVVARAYLDANDKLVRLTFCNLPADSRHYTFPQYMHGKDSYVVLFGRRTDSIDDLAAPEKIHSGWVMGGKHTPWGELASVGYDAAGNLLVLTIPKQHLMPEFLHD